MIIIPEHYLTIASEFSRFQGLINTALCIDQALTPVSRCPQPVKALSGWQDVLQESITRLSGQFQRLSTRALARGCKPGKQQVAALLIPIQQTTQQLIHLRRIIQGHYFRPSHCRGQQLLLACVSKVLHLLTEIFLFFNQATSQPRQVTSYWRQPIHCPAEMASFNLWLRHHGPQKTSLYRRIIILGRSLANKTNFSSNPAM